MAETTVRFGEYELDFARRELRRGGAVVELQPTPRRVLLHLAEHRDRTVPRRELLDAVWPGVVVGDETLTRALAEIRRAVGDDGDAQRVVRTFKGEGYRFVAEVAAAPGEAVAPTTNGVATQADGSPRGDTPEVRRQGVLRARRGWLAAGAGALAAAAVASAVWLRPVEPAAEPTAQPQAVPFGVVVLPVANLSGAASDQRLADGLTEQITSALARSGYPVVARTTAAQWRERAADVRELGRQLGVSHLLEGSVRSSGERSRITIQLVETDAGRQVWSEEFESAGGDAFSIQDEVTNRIAVQVYRYVWQDVVALRRNPALADLTDLIVSQRRLFLEGRWEEFLETSQRILDTAPHDGPFRGLRAFTHGWMSVGWGNLYDLGLRSFAEAGPIMLEHAQRGVALGPEDPLARTALSRSFSLHWRWSDAEREMERTCELSRQGAWCGAIRVHVCAALGCLEQMVQGAQWWVREDPANNGAWFNLSWAQLSNGRLREAETAGIRERELGGLGYFLPTIQWQLGQRVDAVGSLSALLRLAGASKDADEIARRGATNPEAAWRWFAALLENGHWKRSLPSVNDFLAAQFYADLGQLEAALTALERSVGEHEPGMEEYGFNPVFDPIRDTPRFRALIEQMGLTAYHARYFKRPREEQRNAAPAAARAEAKPRPASATWKPAR